MRIKQNSYQSSDNRRFISIIMLVLGFVTSISSSACSAEDAADGRLFVGVDPRIELLAAVQIAAGYRMMGLITWYEFPYVEEFESYFERFNTHPAVKHIRRMIPRGFAYDAPVAIILHYGTPPDLKSLLEVPESYVARAGGKENLEKFIEELRDFARTTSFMEFFDNHKPFYERLAARERGKLGYVNVEDMNTYYGYSQRSYNIILAPLFHKGGYGPRIVHPQGEVDIFSVQGPYGVENGEPQFGSPEMLQELVWHEFSHSFTNPLVDQYWDSLKLYSHIYSPVAEKMTQIGYSDWESCCYEYFVRAVVLRLIALHVGPEEARKALDREVESGFTEISRLTESLKKYEENRNRYPTLKEYFSEMLDVFPEKQ